MKTMKWMMSIFVAVLSMCLIGVVGCQQQESPMEETQEAMEEAGEETMDAAEAGADKIEEAADETEEEM